jgi:hypothetical protein
MVRSYNQALPTAEDYAKEPPPPPAHLQLTLLNVPPAMDAAASLPRPQHVILNHIYCQRATHQALSRQLSPPRHLLPERYGFDLGNASGIVSI